MTFELPPVVKAAERLLVDIEQAVRRFARFHKYQFGKGLRKQAFKVSILTHRAWRERSRQTKWLAKLVRAVDDLKLRLQLGSRIRAFAGLAQFEDLARQAVDLGRQVGGWNRAVLHPKGQSPASRATPERTQKLSSPSAFFEATK